MFGTACPPAADGGDISCAEMATPPATATRHRPCKSFIKFNFFKASADVGPAAPWAGSRSEAVAGAPVSVPPPGLGDEAGRVADGAAGPVSGSEAGIKISVVAFALRCAFIGAQSFVVEAEVITAAAHRGLEAGAVGRALRPGCTGRGLFAVILLGGVGILGATANAAAQSPPDAENGRYTLSPVADGMLRLDTRTGSMSICNDKRNGWACYTLPDERSALDDEIGRLQRENESLRAQLAARDSTTGKTEDAFPKSDSLRKPPDAGRKPETEAPDDLDRALSFLERAWRRLVEMAGRMQRDLSEKI